MFVFSVSTPMQRRALRTANFPRCMPAAGDAARAPASHADAVRVPPLDVIEAGDSYTATLDVPGIAREQFSVKIDGRRVDVSAAAGAPQADAGELPARRERTAPRYARSFVLPAELEPATARARLDNGVLTLTLPKRAARGATTVSVQ